MRIYYKTELNIKSHLDPNIKTIEHLIIKYFDLEQPETYYLDNSLQCTYEKQRSFMDLYYLCKTKFPRISKKLVAKSLVNLCKENIIKILYCNEINNAVFHRRYTCSYIKNGEYFLGGCSEYGKILVEDIIKLAESK